MKKIVSLLLCVALLCSMVVVVAHADGGAASMQVANVTALPGQEVSVDINVVNNPGIAALKIFITDSDSLGIFTAALVEAETTAIEDKTPKTTTLQSERLADGILLWFGSADVTATTFGTLTFTVPEDATTGTYTFVIATGTGAEQAVNSDDDLLAIAGTTFTVTVVEKMITGANVAITAGLAIGLHVQTTNDPNDISIIAVDVDGKEYTTVADYEEGDDDYIYYLNVNPWDMDKVFTIDFADNFKPYVKDEQPQPDTVDLGQLPATAKTIGILSYCELIKGTSTALDKLIADLLEFGRQAQIYKGATTPSFDLPDGLEATSVEWVIDNPDYDPDDTELEEPETLTVSFGRYCLETYGSKRIVSGTSTNSTQIKRFKFDKAEISFGSNFVAALKFANNGGTTALTYARVKVGNATTLYSLDDDTFTHAFSPLQYEGVQFYLYSNNENTGNAYQTFVNNYGPVNYAAYLYEKNCTINEETGEEEYQEGVEEILTILEAFYHYGASAVAYAASLS